MEAVADYLAASMLSLSLIKCRYGSGRLRAVRPLTVVRDLLTMTSHISAERRLHSGPNESAAHDHWACLSGFVNWRETLRVLLWTHPMRRTKAIRRERGAAVQVVCLGKRLPGLVINQTQSFSSLMSKLPADSHQSFMRLTYAFKDTMCYVISGYNTLRRYLRVRQNPPACAAWYRAISFAGHCKTVIGFGRPVASTHSVTFGGPFPGLQFHGGHA